MLWVTGLSRLHGNLLFRLWVKIIGMNQSDLSECCYMEVPFKSIVQSSSELFVSMSSIWISIQWGYEILEISRGRRTINFSNFILRHEDEYVMIEVDTVSGQLYWSSGIVNFKTYFFCFLFHGYTCAFSSYHKMVEGPLLRNSWLFPPCRFRQ